jgi:four helix bundle protein
MLYVKSYKELEVYKKSRIMAREIFELTRDFPKVEKYSLVDQVLRSSRSIGAQIAEAWGKRRYEKLFISKLTDADSEQHETQHWIEISYECEYIDQQKMDDLIKQCEAIGKMLYSMIDKSSSFCQPFK